MAATISVTTSSSPHGGVVYCGVFSSSSDYTSNSDIKLQGHFVAVGASSTSASVIFSDLHALNAYHAYCFVEDSLGNAGSYTVALSNGIEFSTTCCKTVSFSASSPSTVFADLNVYSTLSASSILAYELEFTLSAKPSNSVTANVVFYADAEKTIVQSNVLASPSQFLFTSSSTKFSSNFLVHGVIGVHYVSVEFSGSSVSEYTESPSRAVSLIASASTAPSPVLASAEFDGTGQRMTVSFDTPSDSAVGVTAGASVWKCDLVLAFTGASSASCRWSTPSQIVIVFNYFSVADENVVVGDPIVLLDGVVNGYCYVDVCTDDFAASSSIDATVTADFIQPIATVKVPTMFGLCESLVVDPTQSTGNAGRAWASVVWTVSAADGTDTSAIQAVLAGYTNTSRVITIDSSLLISQTTYTISLGLTNFLQDSASTVLFTAVQSTRVAEESSLFVQISGGSFETHMRSRSLSRTASSLLTVCQGGSITTVTPSVSYTWKVYEVSATNNLNEITLLSTSSNPNVFQTAAYTFDLDMTYQITATATAFWENSTISESASFQVFFRRGEVVALINGHSTSSVQTPVNTVLLLDAGGSTDLDDVGATLSYQWSCKDLSVSTFGSDCFNDLGGYSASDLTSSAVSFPALTLSENAKYEFTVTVESTLNGVFRTSSANVFVEATAVLNLNMSVSILSSGDVYSAQSNLIIASLVV